MKIKASKIINVLFIPFLIIYYETVLKTSVYDVVFNVGYIYMCLFSLPIGIVIYLLVSGFAEKVNRLIFLLIIFCLTFFYGAQLIYYKIFSTFAGLYFFVGAGKATQFMGVLVKAAVNNAFMLLLILLPLFLTLVFYKKIKFIKECKKNIISSVIAAAVIQSAIVFIVITSNSGILSSSYLYTETFLVVDSIDRFGLLTTGRLDLQNILKNTEAFASEPEPVETEIVESKDISTNEEITEYNLMDINFDEMAKQEGNEKLKEMDGYFSTVEPSKTNKYTGMYKGKNLIMITAESFSPYAVSKELTPTLYKMQEEGFKFTDFYTPLWGVSTSDGEYVACTGLLPKEGIWSLYKSSKNYMPFAMGNQLKNLGYDTNAYHDHYFDYYYRNESHPNLGYNYKGLGNGLDVTPTWPESDIEMMELTVPEYINNQPFHTYYMTVSGHLQYNFSGNYIANKNKSLVEQLPYSESVKAYLACNIELDRAVEKLIEKLEEAGIAEDTLIAISPDHYPYGLNKEEISELAGCEIKTNFQLYKGIFILWSKGMESVEINKTCSSLDIIPTLSNLMGLKFDSRLLMGRDIFSDSEPLVIFSDRSWITDKAYCNSETGEITTRNGFNVDNSYMEEMDAKVKNKFKYSARILDDDYYRIIFSK
ncbi:MAG: LTA synthase family protein [Sedimentibacter sp.]